MYPHIRAFITKWRSRSSFFKRVTWKASLLTIFISLLAFTVVLAASGDLDLTFGGDSGWTITDFNQEWNKVYGIAIQPNGKIVAAGYNNVSVTGNYDFAVTRYNANGSPDTTFSGDGKLTTDFGGTDVAWDVAVQPDGKIIVAGRKCNNAGTNCNVALARYKSNGALDSTFGGDGKVVTDYKKGDNGSIGGLATLSNGKILVAGYVWNGKDHDFAVYRYMPNGKLDLTFSFDKDGVAVGSFGKGKDDYLYDLVIQEDGKILVAGVTGIGTNRDFAIARMNANGTEDNSFSGDGLQTTHFGADDLAYGLALQPDGKIVVVGQKITTTTSFIAIARYTKNGVLDTTFNSSSKTPGKKTFRIGGSSYAFDVIVQPNGKIVVAGSAQIGGSFDYALVRLKPGGGFDGSFSGDGKATFDFFTNDDLAYALARQPPNGKYVLGGSVYFDSLTFEDFGLARVLP